MSLTKKASRVAIAGVVVAALLIPTATTSATAATKTALPKLANAPVIRVGYFANLTHGPALIARQQKLFEKFLGKTKVEYTYFTVGTAEIEALKGGAIDVGFVGPGPAISGYVTTKGSLLRIVSGAASGGAKFIVKPSLITTEGKPVFVGLAPGTGESTDAWADFLTDLGDRGLGCPLLVVSDGAKGLIAAIEQIFPKALRQRCLIHRLRNVLAKIPAGMQAEVRDGYWAIFDTADLTVEPGPGLVEIIDKRIEAFAAKYFDLYPAAMRILLTDKAGLTAYLRFPVEHHGRVRHSNFIERSFGETKRRTKVIGRFPGETSAVSLVWAVLDRASAGWRGLSMTPVGTRLLHDLRRSLLDPPRELRLTPSTTSNGTNPADPISATA